MGKEREIGRRRGERGGRNEKGEREGEKKRRGIEDK